MPLEVFLAGQAYIFVFARIAGMIGLNPLLARKNVPAIFKMGLILMLTLLLTPVVDSSVILSMSSFVKVATILKELSVGIVTSLVFTLFYYLLVFAGDFIDMQLGLSMAKAFDPGTNIQFSMTGKILTIMFVLFFFASDAHLLLIKIFAESFKIVPLGCEGLSLAVTEHVLNLFISVFTLAFKLALPFVIAEFTIEAALGILMRVIPQIHVFVVSMQLRIIVGIVLMIAFVPAIASFLSKYLTLMLENTAAIIKTTIT